MNRRWRGIVQILGGRGATIACQFAALLLISHTVRATELAILQLHLSLIGTMATASMLGLDRSVIGSLAACRDKIEDMRRAADSVLGAAGCAALILGSGYVVVQTIWTSPLSPLTTLLAGAAIIAVAIGTLSAEIHRGHGDHATASWSFTPVLQLLNLLAVAAFCLHPPHSAHAEWLLLAYAGAAILAMVLALHRLARLGRTANAWWRPSPAAISTALASRWAFLLSMTLLLAAQADVWIASAVLDLQSAGMYAHAQRIALAFGMPLLLLNLQAIPSIARVMKSGRHRDACALCRRNALLGLVLSAAWNIALLCGGPPLYALVFGVEWAQAWLPCVFLSLAQMIGAGLGPVYLVLFLDNTLARRTVIGLFLILTLGLSASIRIGSELGLVAAAAVIASTSVAMKVYAVITTARATKINTWATCRLARSIRIG